MSETVNAKNTADTTTPVTICYFEENKRHRFYLFRPNDIKARRWSVDADSVEEAKAIVCLKDFPANMPHDIHLQWQLELTRERKLNFVKPVTIPLPGSTVTDVVGLKHDQNKIPYHLLSFYSLECISRVLEFGQKKYAPRNWEKGISWSRVFRACIGHLFDWFIGKEKDPETGMSHLWHAGCCIMFLIHYEKYNREFDDRPKYKESE